MEVSFASYISQRITSFFKWRYLFWLIVSEFSAHHGRENPMERGAHITETRKRKEKQGEGLRRDEKEERGREGEGRRIKRRGRKSGENKAVKVGL